MNDPEGAKTDRLLALGRFTVTGIVTFMLIAVFCWAFLMKNVDNQVFSQVVGMVVAFWFGAATARAMPPPTTPPPPGTTTTVTTPPPPGGTP